MSHLVCVYDLCVLAQCLHKFSRVIFTRGKHDHQIKIQSIYLYWNTAFIHGMSSILCQWCIRKSRSRCRDDKSCKAGQWTDGRHESWWIYKNQICRIRQERPCFYVTLLYEYRDRSIKRWAKKSYGRVPHKQNMRKQFSTFNEKSVHLKVSHEFEDMRTGKTIYKITIGNKDCS